MRLAHPDWLYHRLRITGPSEDLRALRAAARGAGVVPWVLNYDALAEDWSLWLHGAGLDLAEARHWAAQLREAVWSSHETAISWVGRSRGCVFDLHSLSPVPDEMLTRGPDDPVSLDWLWAHWGTTWTLRHVRPLEVEDGFGCEFFAADWTPWPVIADLRRRFSGLRIDLRIGYS